MTINLEELRFLQNSTRADQIGDIRLQQAFAGMKMYLLHELKHKQDSKTDDSFGNLYDRLFELRDELQSKLNDLQSRIEELR